jgi:uncharacterized Zn finger protein
MLLQVTEIEHRIVIPQPVHHRLVVEDGRMMMRGPQPLLEESRVEAAEVFLIVEEAGTRITAVEVEEVMMVVESDVEDMAVAVVGSIITTWATVMRLWIGELLKRVGGSVKLREQLKGRRNWTSKRES